MPESRRHLLMTFAGAFGVLAVEPLLSGLQAPGVRPDPQPRPSPNAPNPNFLPGFDGPRATTTDPKVIKKQNQMEIRTDVGKLYEMVSELKDQVQRIDSDSTLSLAVVKKAQQIEKLARQIKDLAKG